MTKLKKIAAGVGGVGIFLVAIYLAAFLFVILLIVGLIFGVYVYFKSAPLRKEMAKRQAEYEKSHPGSSGPGGVIDADYVVVEETIPDEKRSDPR